VKPETISAYIAALGGTRCCVTVGAGVIDTLLLWFGKISGAEYVQLTVATVAVFIGAAAYQKAQESKNASAV